MSAAPEQLSVTIRRAKLADAPRLAALAGQLSYPSTPEEVAARLRGILPDPEHAIFLAEGKNGEISGYVDVFLLRTAASNARAEIAGMVVDESSRSQGIGQLLMARAEEWAREAGCAEVGLRSNVIRERAHAFYENLGYRVNKTQKSFRKPL